MSAIANTVIDDAKNLEFVTILDECTREKERTRN